jgi:prepilin-type N-terminal cleavage/methylation domain-containing protein
MKRANFHTSAFTLVELMVVISILVLLIAILSPSFRAMKAAARTTVCATRLHGISTAYSTRKAAERINSYGAMTASSWPGVLLSYLGQSKEAMICPEDDARPTGGSEVDLSAYSIYDKSTKFYMALSEAPLTAKLNQSQYDIFNPLEATKNRVPPAYMDDGTGVWWFCFEDLRTDEAGTAGGGDRDFDDIQILCRDLGFGRIELNFKKGGSSHGFAFCDENRQIVPGYDPLTGTSLKYEIAAKVASLSYGMNSRVDKMPPGGKTILAMDYELSVVNTGGSSPTSTIDDWTQPPHYKAPSLTFARHNGRVNVLWSGNEVTLENPSDINPGIEAIKLLYWVPGQRE